MSHVGYVLCCPPLPIFKPNFATELSQRLLSHENERVPVLWGKMDGGSQKEEETYIDYLSYIKFIAYIIVFNSQKHAIQL